MIEINSFTAALSQTGLKVEKHVDNLKTLNSGQVAASLSKAVNQYKVLKRQFTMLQTRLLLYEMLEGGECPGIQQIEDERKTTMEEIRGHQAEIEDSKSNIENLSEQLQNALSSYQAKRVTLQRRLEDVSEKKKKFEEHASGKEHLNLDNLSHLNMVLQRVQHELGHMSAAEKKWEDEITSLRRVHTDLQQTERAAHQLLQDQEDRREQLLRNNSHCGKAIESEQKELLHGIQSIQFLDNTLQIKFKPQGLSSGVGMQLSVKFVNEGEHRIKSASLDPSGVEIDDLVNEAQKTNDVVYLVSAVSTRWLQSHRLISEIETLRHRFALDWRHSEGVVQVLYGKVVCCLKVENNYPSPKSVHLASISGTDKDIQTSSSELTTLTEWLEHLEAELQ